MKDEKDGKLLLLSRLYDDILNNSNPNTIYKCLMECYPELKNDFLESIEVLIVKEAERLEKEGYPISDIMKTTHPNITGGTYGRK